MISISKGSTQIACEIDWEELLFDTDFTRTEPLLPAELEKYTHWYLNGREVSKDKINELE